MNSLVCLVMNHFSFSKIYFIFLYLVFSSNFCLFQTPYKCNMCFIGCFYQKRNTSQKYFIWNRDPDTQYHNANAMGSTFSCHATCRSHSKRNSECICCESLRYIMELVLQNAFFKHFSSITFIENPWFKFLFRLFTIHSYYFHDNLNNSSLNFKVIHDSFLS